MNKKSIFSLCVGLLISSIASVVFAGLQEMMPPPPPPPPPSGPETLVGTPDNAIDDDVASIRDRGIDQVFGGDPVSAGGAVEAVEDGTFTFFSDFSYLDIDDQRLRGFSGESHGLLLGFDWISANDLLASMAYGYHSRDQDFNLGGGSGFDLDTHSISTLLLKRSRQFEHLAYGLAGGFSSASATAFNLAPGTLNGVDADTWVLNPFIASVCELGPVLLRGQVGYYQNWSENDVGQVVATLRGSYDVTECLAVTAHVGWHNITSDDRRNFILGQDNNWAEVGMGLVLFPGRDVSFYSEWTYTAANSDFKNHRFQMGTNFKF